MKLVLFVVSAVVIFCADSRDFPDKPDMGNFAVHRNEHTPSQQERKGEKELKLRGNAGKKNIKTLIKKLKNITINLDSIKDGNTKLTKDNSDMKIENQAIKKSLDSLKDGNTKMTQDISQMKIEDQAIKKSLDSLKVGNTKLTQAISQINTQLQAIKNQQGPFLIGGQYLSFSKEKVTWAVAKTKCSSLNARLAVLDDPKAFLAYANANIRGTLLWLGASDISREGTWTWINGKSLGDSFPWYGSEPNNQGGHEDCLEWNGGYNDRPCTYTWGYVCEHGY